MEMVEDLIHWGYGDKSKVVQKLHKHAKDIQNPWDINEIVSIFDEEPEQTEEKKNNESKNAILRGSRRDPNRDKAATKPSQ